VWAATNLTGLRVGTFRLINSNTYQCRDSVAIGAVTAGSALTFCGLNIAVTAGDFIGCYFATGTLERDTAGFSGIKDYTGESIDPGDIADFGGTLAGDAISLYATGYSTSPAGNNGTITGATWSRLPSGLWVLNMDGSDDIVTAPLVLDGVTPWYVGCWFAPLSITPNDGLWSVDPNYTIYLNVNKLDLYWGDTLFTCVPAANLVVGKWTYLGIGRDGSNWVSDLNETPDFATATSANVVVSTTLYIGGQGLGAYGNFRQALYRVVMGRVPSTAERAGIFQSERAFFGV
jgi:hypothetical protein